MACFFHTRSEKHQKNGMSAAGLVYENKERAALAL